MSALIITGPRGTVPRQFHPRRPPLDVFPLRDWMRLMRRQWAGLRREHLDYGDPSGLPALREAIARHVGVTRGIHCNPDQVIVTNGSQQAFDVLFRTLLDPGDSVWIEDPGPLEVRGALLAAGAQLQPIAVDKDGIDVAVGIESAPKARLAVVSPSHQYPTGTTLSAKRRRTLLEWAAAARSWVIEDDYDSHFRYQGRPMAGLVTLNLSPAVIHVGTFSKTMFPSLRLGFCIVPHTIAAAVSNARAIADRNSPLATQAALAEFIDSGQYDRHLRRVRIACQERYVALRDSFARYVGATAALSDASAGSHVLAWLENEGAPSPESRATRVARDAAAAGLAIFPLSRYHLVPPRRDALVLGYGTMTPDRIAAGTRVLADIIRKTV